MTIEPIVFEYHGLQKFELKEGLEYIRDASADIIAITSQRTEQRLLDFSFSNSLYKVKGGFLIHQTKNVYNNLWSFISVLDIWTWLAILFLLFMQSGVCFWIRKIESIVYKTSPVDFLEVVHFLIKLKIRPI
jgi:hypothetical protein